jgi:hypothetical protein
MPPGNLQTFEFRVPSQRKLLSVDELDEFIETRFPQATKLLIEAALV